MHRFKQIDSLQSRLARDRWTVPVALHQIAIARTADFQMCRQGIRQTTDFAPAHCVRLAGHRERTGAGLADAAGIQMAVDDGIDFVRALRSEEHTSELQSLMRISYAVFC